jgi:hypothetical protein
VERVSCWIVDVAHQQQHIETVDVSVAIDITGTHMGKWIVSGVDAVFLTHHSLCHIVCDRLRKGIMAIAIR